ncbi:MAG: porin [Desulfobacterales bacterium]|nr:porin [Desulfobacterales bacterium]
MKKLIVVAIAAVAMFASSAYAADWNFYGSARIWTFSTDVEEIGTSDSDRNTNWELSPYSRIGANVKVSDELSARFEYGTGVNLRLLYGEWNFGSGSLTIGQDYEPIYLAYSNQAYDGDGMGGTGDAYNGRSAQLKLKFGEFQVALLEPFSGDNSNGSYFPTSTGSEVTIPKIQARYTFRFDNGSARIVGGYNTYEETLGGNDVDITSYMLGAGADFNFGAFRLAGNVVWGENAAALMAVDANNLDNAAGTQFDGMARVTAGGDDVNDSEIIGFQIIVGYTVNDMIGLEAGYGWIEEEVDNVSGDDEAANYYVQMPITLAPGVSVTPEVGFYDYEEDGQDEITYFGAKWQINF